MSSDKITPDDIRKKLSDIQDQATETVEGARNQLIAVGAGVALLLVVLAFVLGRRGGAHRNTIIEVKRA
ncbi:MAG: hypothetical protein U0Q22_07515 [Acidimicrobiales bacterium]